MPVTAIINMRALDGGRMPRSFHCLMHPTLLDRISRAHRRLGDVLHNAGMMSPFSISPVMGKKERGAVVENESYWVRVSILHEEIEEVFMETLGRGLWDRPLRLGELSFLVENVLWGDCGNHPWSGRDSYRQLVETAQAPRKLALGLASPVSFKRGDLHYPLPEPALVFGNLARRWNLFASLQLPEKPACADVSYASFDLSTKPFHLRNGGTILGARGRLTFIFGGDEEARRYYHTLLRFAFYAGIGVKTTQGMGLCRILEVPDTARPRGRTS